MLAIASVAGMVIMVGIVLVVALIWLLRRDTTSGGTRRDEGGGLATAYAEVSSTPHAVALAPTATTMPVAEESVVEEASMATETPVPTGTLPPTFTPVPSGTPLPTYTLIPSDTPLPTYTPTPTNTPSPTSTPTLTPAPTADNDTGYRPYPIFNTMWEDSGGGSGPLGYPTGPAVTDRNYAKQYFERGFMYWWQSPFTPEPIWVVVIPDPAASRGSTWMQFDNAWESGQPLFPPNCPEATEPLGPMAGFGVAWCDQTGVKEQIGAPREREFGSGDVYPKGAVQFFQNGVMFESPADRQVWALVPGTGWQRAGY